jgi:hypothetical protein
LFPFKSPDQVKYFHINRVFLCFPCCFILRFQIKKLQMKTIQLTAAATFLTITTLIGCKKDKDEARKPDCRIITATPTPTSSGDPFNISYNSEGKISTLSQDMDVTTFAYSGNTVIATTNTSGTFARKNIITLNADGLATNVRTETNTSGTDWTNQAFEYSGTEIIKATTTSSGGGTPSVSIVTWSNGNLVSITSGSSTTTLDYYTDKPAQTGDYLSLAQLVAGYQIYRTKNAIKSILSGSSINNFDYSFDGDGKITSLIATGASNTTYSYQHQCN